jgi:preprotein translocase SecE subunit
VAKKHVARPLRAASNFGKKEYYLPMPKNKVGNFLNKKRSVIPKFLKESVSELKQVAWPTWKVTLNLSIAVFLFAFFFGLVIAVTDYGLDKLFKQLIIK